MNNLLGVLLFTLMPALSFGAVPYVTGNVPVDENFSYVDSNTTNKLPKTGGTITGDLTIKNANIVFSTTTGSKGITFQDGTSQVSAGVGALAIVSDTGQFTGNGTLATPLTLKSSSVTLQGNTFGSANKLLMLDSSGKVPTGNLPADGYAGTYVNVGEAIPGSVVDLSTVTTALNDKLTSPATFYIVKTSDYLTNPATFYVVRTSDYLVAPASFTYLNASSSLNGSNIDSGRVSGSYVDFSTVTTHILTMIPSSATGTYPLSIGGNANSLTGTIDAGHVTAGTLGIGTYYFGSDQGANIASVFSAPSTGNLYLNTPNSRLEISSSVIAMGSIQALKGFIGDGSQITGVTSADPTKLPLTGGTLETSGGPSLAFHNTDANGYSSILRQDYANGEFHIITDNLGVMDNYGAVPRLFVSSRGVVNINTAGRLYTHGLTIGSGVLALSSVTVNGGIYGTVVGSSTLNVLKSGDTMTGQLTVLSSVTTPTLCLSGDTGCVTKLPQNTPAIADNYLTAYNRTTGVFTQSPVGHLEMTVRNETGATLPLGTLVYMCGFNNFPLVCKADNTVLIKTRFFGVIKAALNHQADGQAVVHGSLSGIDTNAWNVADALYMSGNGLMTNTVPTFGLVQEIGIVRIKDNVGEIEILPTPSMRYKAAPLNENLFLRMGGVSSTNTVNFVNYSNVTVSSVNALGNAYFNNYYGSSVTAYNVTVSSTVCFPDGSCMSAAASGSGSVGSTTTASVSFKTQFSSSTWNGTINTLTLTNTPLPNSLSVVRNGSSLYEPGDYSLSGAVVTFVAPPASSSTVKATYAIADSSTSIYTATGTWTAGQVFSSVTFPTRGNITFQNELHNSSSTLIIADFSTNVTSGFRHVTGSSLTITTNGGRVMIGFVGSVSNDIATDNIILNVKQDDVLLATYPMGLFHIVNPGNNYRSNGSFTVVSEPLAAGTHTFGLYLRPTANTATVRCLNTGAYVSNCRFWIQELR